MNDRRFALIETLERRRPQADKKVVTIDYLSKKDETVAAPFCVAITLEPK
jgi:hypothetical protein